MGLEPSRPSFEIMWLSRAAQAGRFVRYPIPMSLIHELGHRLNQQIKTLPDDMTPRP